MKLLLEIAESNYRLSQKWNEFACVRIAFGSLFLYIPKPASSSVWLTDMPPEESLHFAVLSMFAC